MTPSGFIQLIESPDRLRELARYLEEKPISLLDCWPAFLMWRRKGYGPDGDAFAALADKIGCEDEGPITDERGEIESLWELEGMLSSDDRSNIADNMMQYDAGDAPSWAHMTFNCMLPRQTWLVHKTDEQHTILRDGFRGTPDMTVLGLTSYRKKREGGYNFAYVADEADESKYGEHAMMFQATAVLVDHFGDDERQAIFWGPSVDRRRIICIDRENGWSGDDERGREYNWVVSASNGRKLFKSDTLIGATDWVTKNAQSYRKALQWTP